MHELNIESNFKDEIDKIWDASKFSDESIVKIIKNGYCAPTSVAKNALLFVGINPSLRKRDKKTRGERKFYTRNDIEGDPYFNKFIELEEKTKLHWTHIDLLFIRETKQESVEKMWDVSISREFLMAQLSISKRIIELAEPKIIVVSNAFARDLLGEKGKLFEFDFDNTLGTHKIVKHETLSGIPVFFTSMLTGQRALDKGSFERLAWHINFVREHIR